LENDDFMLIAKTEGEIIGGAYILYGYSITKYNYQGEIDGTFGKDGIVFLDKDDIKSIRPYRMKILNNGSIIIAGTYNEWPNTELGFCKLTFNGDLDTSFANDGIWHKDIMQDFDLDHESFSNVFEDNEGNLILSGWGLNYRSFLSKFSPNGILNTSFGDDGFYCFNSLYIHQPIIQIGDKYLTAGWSGSDKHHKIIIINNDGSSADVAYTCEIYYFQAMKRQGDHKIILGGGYDETNFSDNFALERIIVDYEVSIKPDDYLSNDPVIFPNPTKENLYFSDEMTFEIFDIQGEILLTSSTPVSSVNIGSLSAGVYFIRFGNRIQKFVKE
jgi:uncharacterized delta-60 repeat protein